MMVRAIHPPPNISMRTLKHEEIEKNLDLGIILLSAQPNFFQTQDHFWHSKDS